MELNRLRISENVSHKLSLMKGRTGLTPNILCRIGFCLSLNDPTIPVLNDYADDTEKEINRHTLTGQWDSLFVALIKERCRQDGLTLDDKGLAEQFRAHTNRGVLLLYKQIRSLNDLAQLMPHDIRKEVGDTSQLEGVDG